jgi:hypothetical protein
MQRLLVVFGFCTQIVIAANLCTAAEDRAGSAFYERKIRPLLVKHCYSCHSEKAKKQEGGLLLDRSSGWLKGGDTNKAVVPRQPNASLLIKAVRYKDENLQMPPDKPLDKADVQLLERWVRLGAPGPVKDLGTTAFSRLGDQTFLAAQAKTHWAFQPIKPVTSPQVADVAWNRQPVDQFISRSLVKQKLTPSSPADSRTLIRRLTFDLTGLPPASGDVKRFIATAKKDRPAAVRNAVNRLVASSAYGEHIGRMWLDVARYADTDSFYRPDTRTPHYFPFAFTYRDYVIAAFNKDKPYDQFLREQLAADLMGFSKDAPELAALGFLAVGPHSSRNQAEALDDWIDLTTRGLMGLTAACARCHDHKFEPIPTVDYYSLRGIFASVVRPNALLENQLPAIRGYEIDEALRRDYEKKRAAIDKKIKNAGGKVAKNNRRSIAQKIRETELAQLLLFHRGGPVHAMVVKERRRPLPQFVYVRGDRRNRGENAPRRFLKILDPKQSPFPANTSGRLQLAKKIASPDNPLTSRVFVNRVWGMLMGSPLVNTPSDFGLQGGTPTHPELLDWLSHDFVTHGWSVKRLVRTIVMSRTYQQRSGNRDDMTVIDSTNRLYWRANRKHLSIEAIRDSLLAVSGKLDRTPRGRAARMWGENYTRRRTIYGYINRFNLDPTLRVFDFPTPMQSQPARGESIVAPQALFAMNSPFVIDQAAAITQSKAFLTAKTDAHRVTVLFDRVYQRTPDKLEVRRITNFVKSQSQFFRTIKSGKKPTLKSAWPLVAQSLLMSNEFQYLD